MRVSATLPSAALVLLLAPACVTDTELLPAAADQRVQGREDLAVDRVAGVELLVDGAPDLGLPAGTEEAVAAVRLRVRNLSDEPVRLRYREFRLREPSGREHAALPPWQIEAEALAGTSPAFTWDRFFVAQPYAPFVRGVAPWDGPFEVDPFYNSAFFPRWADALPTEEMMAQALPEGVLIPGGSVEGLLYFEDYPGQRQLVTFHFDVVNANTNARMGRIEIPFYVARSGPAVARR